MKSERIILSFVAVLVGLMAAGGTFFLYQHYVKKPPVTKVLNVSIKPSPTLVIVHNSNDYLNIDNPSDEQVVTMPNIQITGKATKDATIIVSTPINDQAAISSNDGSFSLTTTLDNDTNQLLITAIFPDRYRAKDYENNYIFN